MINLTKRTVAFFKHPFFSDPRTLLGLWLLLPVVAALTKMSKHNNFLIFKYVYWHTIEQLPLYSLYPEQYHDCNHYGPFFSLVIAPFALLPTWWGLLFWLIALSVALYIAIRKLPLANRQRIFIYWFCAHELLTALFMSQFNIAIAAIIIGAFYCIEKEKDFWAVFLIMLGTFVKLYGIVGLAFFFFSKHQGKFLLSLIFWGGLMFAAPMLISSPEYILSQYADGGKVFRKKVSKIYLLRIKIFLCWEWSERFHTPSPIPIFGLLSEDYFCLPCHIYVFNNTNISISDTRFFPPFSYLSYCSVRGANPVPISLHLSGLPYGTFQRHGKGINGIFSCWFLLLS